MGKSNRFSLSSKSHASSRFNPYDRKTLTATNVSCPKVHVSLPKLEGNGTQQICIELQTLIIFAIALGTQYLNLYRSTWWLSNRTNRIMNFHLIDTDVSLFTLLFIGQPSFLSILRTLMSTGMNLFNQKFSPFLSRQFYAASRWSSVTSTKLCHIDDHIEREDLNKDRELEICKMTLHNLSCQCSSTNLKVGCSNSCSTAHQNHNLNNPSNNNLGSRINSHVASSVSQYTQQTVTNKSFCCAQHQTQNLTHTNCTNGSSNTASNNSKTMHKMFTPTHITSTEPSSPINHDHHRCGHTMLQSNHNNGKSAQCSSVTVSGDSSGGKDVHPQGNHAQEAILKENCCLHPSEDNHGENNQGGSGILSATTIESTASSRSMPIGFYAAWLCSYHLIKCAYRIWTNFGTNGLLCISYPIVVSLIINSTNVMQAAEECRKTGKVDTSFLTMFTQLFSHARFDDDKLCHVCSNQPEEIREEVDKLRTIFNERLKYILFKSILIAYYSSFVPLCFTQSYLYYDVSWTAQHVAITWFSALIMLISCSYTPHFYHVLHRSAYHFGKWQKLETRNTLVPCINWSENMLYPQGVVVKHSKGYFRSESVSNCAQPGCASHLRYYMIFSNPKIGFATPLTMLGILVTVQMYLLLVSFEWYKLISMTLMMLINVHSIFRLVKSLIVITKIYNNKNEKKQ